MADVAFGTVNLVLGLIQDEARLLGGVREDLRFIMQEMESMNNVLRHLVANKGSAAAGDYHLRPWMKQVLELAFDSRNCVELYTQSGSGRCDWLPWAMIARHRVVSRIRELKVRAREISERQARYGIAVAHPQRYEVTTSTESEPRDTSVCNQRRTSAGSSNNSSRRDILDDGWFGDYSSVDEALARLKPFTEDCYPERKPPAQLNGDGNQLQPRPQLEGGDKHNDKEQPPPPQPDGGNKDQPPMPLPPSQSDSGDKEQPPLPQSGGGVTQQPSPLLLQSDGGDKHDDKEQPPSPQSDGDVKQQPSPTQSHGGDNQQHIRCCSLMLLVVLLLRKYFYYGCFYY